MLTIFYFLFRVFNLTKLPIFNDEAIYLDWGWRETHNPGYLYYSLYDAKQPLLMWIFGIMQQILPDPLFAGRIVSVFTGFLALLGIFKISENLFNRKPAFLASVFYMVIPIFSFYDRQALMESAIGAVGIWACYFLIKALNSSTNKYPIILGIILGIGFFIKSSSLIFIVSILVIIFINYFIEKKVQILKNIFWIFLSFFIFDLLLFINPDFWNTLNKNSQFSFSFSELIHFPIATWVNNLLGNLQIAIFYLTPLCFLAAIAGLIIILKKNKKEQLVLFLWITIPVLIEIILARQTTQRYIVSFLPLIVIPAGLFLSFFYNKFKILGTGLILITFVIPLLITILQIFNPQAYIKEISRFTDFSQNEYIKGQTSGYGVYEAISFIKEKTGSNKAFIGVAENTGNPESAMMIYFNKNKNIKTVYMDSKLFGDSINTLSCLTSKTPIYFVSRDNQQAGLEKFFQKIKTIKNPYGVNSIGIYILKENCKGKSLELIPQKT